MSIFSILGNRIPTPADSEVKHRAGVRLENDPDPREDPFLVHRRLIYEDTADIPRDRAEGYEGLANLCSHLNTETSLLLKKRLSALEVLLAKRAEKRK